MMIAIVETHNIPDKKQALADFAINTDILLVASLNDKIFWRNHFLTRTQILTDETVQRASDFWHKLLLYVPESYQIVSPAFLKSYLQELINEQKIALQSDTIYRLLLDFQDILYADDLHDIFEEWVSTHVSPTEPWVKYIDDLKFIINHLETKKWVTRDLLPALLYKNRDAVAQVIKQKRIFVSLDLSLSVIETKLLLALADTNHVTVIIPIVEPIENFIWDYQIYKPLGQDSALLKSSKVMDLLFSAKKRSSPVQIKNPHVTYKEFNSIINEVMYVIGKIRQLLSSGVSMQDISILSASKERYTLLFDTFLQLEGLHSLSTQDSSLMGVKDLQYLIGTLKLKTSEIETEELELSTYYKEAEQSYLNFAKKFTNIYQSKDVESLLSKMNVSDKDQSMDKFKFLDWFFEGQQEIDASPFTGILNDVPEGVSLKQSSWIQYLQQSLQSKFLRKSTIHDGVMQVLDILESSLQENKHVFILGLNDKDIKEKQNAFMDSSDIERLALDLGFVFPSHFSQTRMLATLQILQEKNQVYLSFSKHDVTAEMLEPSIFHFLLEENKGDIPNSFVLENQKPYSESDTFKAERAISVPHAIQRLSATQLESYIKCPFIYYAKYVLKLPDTNVLDLDIDPMTSGNIIHFALAILVENPQWPHVGDRVLEESLKASMKKYQDSIKEPDLEDSFKIKMLEHLTHFRDFETTWRALHPKTKTVGTEYAIESYLDKNGYFHAEEGEGRIPFVAKVDRIDTDGAGNYLIVDYKFRKNAQHTNIATWFSKGSLQLAMYSMVLEDTKRFEDINEVVGALYFTIKPMQRMKGFLLKSNNGLYTYEGKGAVFIDQEKKQAYYQNLRDTIRLTLESIQQGDFNPKPLDINQCENCTWRNTCRASHLN